MNEKIKRFIEDNINLIESNEWELVYEKAKNNLEEKTGQFTEVVLEAGINPENYLTELPSYFLYESDIKEFTIPKNITNIGTTAFYNCESLTRVEIPNSITSIGEWAFFSCTSLTSITIPDSVKEIGKYAFQNCDILTIVTIPDNATNIGECAFFNCSGLKNVIISNGIKSISDYAFYNCGDNLIIEYSGTKDDWKKIYTQKAFENTYFICHCTDGKLVKRKR